MTRCVLIEKIYNKSFFTIQDNILGNNNEMTLYIVKNKKNSFVVTLPYIHLSEYRIQYYTHNDLYYEYYFNSFKECINMIEEYGLS